MMAMVLIVVLHSPEHELTLFLPVKTSIGSLRQQGYPVDRLLPATAPIPQTTATTTTTTDDDNVDGENFDEGTATTVPARV